PDPFASAQARRRRAAQLISFAGAGMALALTASCTTIGAPASMISGEVRRGIAAALEAQDKSGVTLVMQRLAAMGASLSPETQARLAPLLDPSLLPPPPPQWSAQQTLASNFRYNALEHINSEPLPRYRHRTA